MADRTKTDHYTVLGITHRATKSEIDAAWRRAVKEWHPDRNRSDEANNRLKAINVARNVLIDDNLRRKYDREHGFGAAKTAARKMERPVKSRGDEPIFRRNGSQFRQPGFATRESNRRPRTPKVNASGGNRNEWWSRFAAAAKRNAESVKNEALRAAAERDRENVSSVIERRPRLTKYVLLPAGVLAILLAALFTVILV